MPKQVVDQDASEMIHYSLKKVRGQTDHEVVQSILLIVYFSVSTTSSADRKQHCCFLYDKSVLGVFALRDSASGGICGG